MRARAILALAFAATAALWARPARAGEVDALLQKLVEKGEITEAEAQQIRDQAGAEGERAEAKAAPKAAPLAWAGDVRLRHEVQWRASGPGRNRERIRLRAGFRAAPAARLEAGVRVATGTALDPIALNQTLASSFDKKDVFLDLAYLRYASAPAAGAGLGYSIVGGKFESPFTSTTLVWDADVTMEGFAARVAPVSGPWEWSLTVGAFPLAELKDKEDPGLFGAQVGLAWSPARSAACAALRTLKLRAAAAYYDYAHLDEGLPTSNGSTFGNTRSPNAAGTASTAFLRRDFNDADFVAEAASVLFGRPVRVTADYVRNTAPGGCDEGYQVGARWGRADQPLAVEIGGYYERVEADAVLGRFTESEFGDGGTGQKGTMAWINVGTLQNSAFGVKWSSTVPIAPSGGRVNRLSADWTSRF